MDGLDDETRRKNFRDNLKEITHKRGKGWTANHLGLPKKMIYRWLNEGIKRPDKRTQEKIEQLAQLGGLDDWHDLWRAPKTKEAKEKDDQQKRRKQWHDALDKLLGSYMAATTQTAINDLFDLWNGIEAVIAVTDPLWDDLSQEELDAIAPDGIDPVEFYRPAVQQWKEDPEAFDPKKFIQGLLWLPATRIKLAENSIKSGESHEPIEDISYEDLNNQPYGKPTDPSELQEQDEPQENETEESSDDDWGEFFEGEETSSDRW